MPPIGTKKSRSQQVQLLLNQSIRLKIAPNCIKFVQMGPNRLKQVNMDPNWSKKFEKGTKWVQMGQLGLNKSKWVKMGPQGSKIGDQHYHELNGMAFKPRSPGSCLTSARLYIAQEAIYQVNIGLTYISSITDIKTAQ